MDDGVTMILDKEKRTNHIRDLQLKFTMIKNLSKAESVLKSHEVKVTDFMNPYELKNFISILRGIDEICFRVCEYALAAERKQIQMYPCYLEEEHLNLPFRALRITVKQDRGLRHRDYLGSLLGLGIRREKTGDIYVHSGYADLIVEEGIADYIQMNLESVSKEKAWIEEVQIDKVKPAEDEYEQQIVYLASTRADAVIAEMFQMSRAKAQSLIAAECLRVDYELISSNSTELKEGALISLKGHGRGYFDEVLTTTRKGRLRVKIRLLK